MANLDPHTLPSRHALNAPVQVSQVLGHALRNDARINLSWIATPLGPMITAADQTHLHLLEFTDRKALPTALRKLDALAKQDMAVGRTPIADQTQDALDHYFAGDPRPFTIPLALHGTPFTRAVWQQLQKIPAGSTATYGQLAQAVDRPDATRAVARANGANQIAILIPCHRIIAANGDLTGYGGGLWRKARLLKHERQMQRIPT